MRLLRLSLRQKREYAGYLFILPWIAGFVSLLLVPLAQSVVFSMSRIQVVGGGYTLQDVGWQNYRHLLTAHPTFLRVVSESVGNMLADVPLILTFSIFAALLIRTQFRGRVLARIIFFLPVIISSGVVLKLQAQGWMKDLMLSSLDMEEPGTVLRSFALQRYLLESGLQKELVLYLTGAVNRINEIICRSGVQILLALAGLQSIPDSFYEAARMEGATGWEIFWKITFPIMGPVLFASAVYSIVDSFTAFDNRTMEMVRVTAFGQSQYGLSAAMSWIYFLMVAVILLFLFGLAAKKIYYRE